MYVHVKWSPRASHCSSLSIDLPIQLWVTMNHSGSTHTKTVMCTGTKEDDTKPADERLFWDLQELDRVYHYHQPKTANSMSDQVCISNITLQKPATTRAVSLVPTEWKNPARKCKRCDSLTWNLLPATVVWVFLDQQSSQCIHTRHALYIQHKHQAECSVTWEPRGLIAVYFKILGDR
jgi:hypothetical protein